MNTLKFHLATVRLLKRLYAKLDVYEVLMNEYLSFVDIFLVEKIVIINCKS